MWLVVVHFGSPCTALLVPTYLSFIHSLSAPVYIYMYMHTVSSLGAAKQRFCPCESGELNAMYPVVSEFAAEKKGWEGRYRMICTAYILRAEQGRLLVCCLFGIPIQVCIGMSISAPATPCVHTSWQPFYPSGLHPPFTFTFTITSPSTQPFPSPLCKVRLNRKSGNQSCPHAPSGPDKPRKIQLSRQAKLVHIFGRGSRLCFGVSCMALPIVCCR